MMKLLTGVFAVCVLGAALATDDLRKELRLMANDTDNVSTEREVKR